MEFKLVIADPKTGKCVQKTAAEDSARSFMGMKIGNSVKGEVIGLTGYEFMITGGSDFCGFPMRKGISGARKRVLIEQGVGFRGGRKGMRKRKTVCGETINDKIIQINLKIMKYGAKKLEAEKKEGSEESAKAGSSEESAKEGEKPAEKPKEEKPKEEKKEGKPKEEKK